MRNHEQILNLYRLRMQSPENPVNQSHDVNSSSFAFNSIAHLKNPMQSQAFSYTSNRAQTQHNQQRPKMMRRSQPHQANGQNDGVSSNVLSEQIKLQNPTLTPNLVKNEFLAESINSNENVDLNPQKVIVNETTVNTFSDDFIEQPKEAYMEVTKTESEDYYQDH